MERPGPAPAADTVSDSSTTENPIAAVGRKVKSVLGTDQRPSVRIIRKPASIAHDHLPVSRDDAEKHADRNGGAATANHSTNAGHRFGGSMRSWFGRTENSKEHDTNADEYDPDTVDLLDVVGLFSSMSSVMPALTPRRSRGRDPFHSDQRAELSLRALDGEAC